MRIVPCRYHSREKKKKEKKKRKKKELKLTHYITDTQLVSLSLSANTGSISSSFFFSSPSLDSPLYIVHTFPFCIFQHVGSYSEEEKAQPISANNTESRAIKCFKLEWSLKDG